MNSPPVASPRGLSQAHSSLDHEGPCCNLMPTAMEVTNHYMHGQDLPVNTWGRPLHPETTQTTSQQHSKYSPISVSEPCARGLGTERALAVAKLDKKCAVSDDQRPPSGHDRPLRSIQERPALCVVWPPSNPPRPALWLRVWACRLDGPLTPTLCQLPAALHQTMGSHPQRFPTCGRQRGRAANQGLHHLRPLLHDKFKP